MNINIVFFKIEILSIVFLGTFVLLVSSCSNEDYLGGHVTEEGRGTPISVQAAIVSDLKSDAAVSPDEVISITTGYEDNTSLNRIFVCGADGKSFIHKTGYPLYVKAATNLLAYYPFQGVEGTDPELVLNTTNQSDIKDLFVAKSSEVVPGEAGVVDLPMVYAYAQMQMNIKVPEGERLLTFRLSGLRHEGRMNAFTHAITLEEASSSISGTMDGNQLQLTLIPQLVTENNKANIVFLGMKRSYTVGIDSLDLRADVRITADVNLRDGMGTIEFVAGSGQWTDSGAGGNMGASER